MFPKSATSQKVRKTLSIVKFYINEKGEDVFAYYLEEFSSIVRQIFSKLIAQPDIQKVRLPKKYEGHCQVLLLC